MRCIALVSPEEYCFDFQNINNFISKYANIPNPITKFFNKLDYVKLDGDYSKNIEWLEAMKKVPLYVKCIKISSNNTEELEILTDPNLHSTPISNLRLELLKSFKISSKTIENLQSIYPKSITLDDYSVHSSEIVYQVLFGNFTKLLTKLDQTSLEMGFYGDKYYFTLEFNDVIFKVVESKKECSYIRAKSVKIHCTDEDFCWIK